MAESSRPSSLAHRACHGVPKTNMTNKFDCATIVADQSKDQTVHENKPENTSTRFESEGGMSQEQTARWQNWRQWAQRVEERDAQTPEDLRIMDGITNYLVHLQDPTSTDHDYVSNHAKIAEIIRSHIQDLLVELTSKGGQREVYLHTSDSHAVKTTTEKAAASIRSHYAELLAGNDVPHEDVVMVSDALETDARLQHYAQARLKELDSFSDEQELIVSYGNYPNLWVMSAGKIKERYRNYSIDDKLSDSGTGGLCVLAGHGDLEAYKQEIAAAENQSDDTAFQNDGLESEPDPTPEEIRDSLIGQIKNHVTDDIQTVVIHVGSNVVRLGHEEAESLIKNLRDEDLLETRIVSGW